MNDQLMRQLEDLLCNCIIDRLWINWSIERGTIVERMSSLSWGGNNCILLLLWAGSPPGWHSPIICLHLTRFFLSPTLTNSTSSFTPSINLPPPRPLPASLVVSLQLRYALFPRPHPAQLQQQQQQKKQTDKLWSMPSLSWIEQSFWVTRRIQAEKTGAQWRGLTLGLSVLSADDSVMSAPLCHVTHRSSSSCIGVAGFACTWDAWVQIL